MQNSNDDHLYPLTLPQRTFYYDYLLHRNDSKYNMGGVLILNGALDVELLGRAYQFITGKFDVFRQRFVSKDGELFQTFDSETETDIIEYVDLRQEKNPFESAMQFLLQENSKPFPFEKVRLYREMVFQTAEKQFILFPRFHHFSNDAYGRSIVNQALSDTYNSLLATGGYPEIKGCSYLDFLEDDLKYRESEYYKDSTLFWQKKLSPLPEPMDFTSKKYSLKTASLHTERITLNLHRMCYASILKIAGEIGVSSFQTLLGILFTTFYKIYGKSDIIIGMPVLNRSNHKFRNTPGLFMNMIPVRLRLQQDWTFANILNAIKLEVKESYRHQRLPLSETFKHFRGNPGFRNELFDVTVIYRKVDFSQRFGEAKLQSVTLDTQIRTESISLEIDEYDEEENVNLFFNYNPLVFSEQEMMQFARCFETVLFELIYFPEKKISEVKFLTPFEEHKIVKVFNQTGEVKKTKDTIVSRFESCAKLFPEKAAVVYHEKSINYSALNRESDRIAGNLAKRHQVKKGDIVCLAAERTPRAIAAMLGIMKTGAVYLPVDGRLPRERLSFILENSRAKLLATDNPAHTGLPVNIFTLDETEDSGDIDIPAEIKQNDLAYIIYTSGSTGAPKGVMIEHGSFMHMFVNMIENYHVTEDDRVLQFASPGFDASVFEIFQALLTGATLVIADRETIQDPPTFIQYMNDKKVSVATLPPAYLNALDKPELPHLHTLITAGEAAIPSDVDFYKKRKNYINGYGPTEASVCASWFQAGRESENAGTLPIGKAVPGSSIYILNEQLEPLPAGFAGELFISGPGLARGYLNNETLTAQKFIPDPFEKNRHMYRTGDKARFLPDGHIEFLGRLDDQVKIKGNRIELGEIENRLHKHKLVKETVVLDVDTSGSKELAAFVVPSGEVATTALREFLLEFLPEYMVPQYFVFIEKVPLTPNGKVNKNELRKQVSFKRATVVDDAAEPTALELKLIPLFEDVLNHSPVKVNDNFFELGGESLKTARLITRIKRELGLEINFKSVFDHPTVRGVATALAAGKNNDEDDIQKAPEQEFYQLSHAQKRLWVLSQDKKNAAVYNMPVSFLLEGNLDRIKLENAIYAVVKRHEILRTIFIEREGEPFQKVLNNPSVPFNFYDFSKGTDGEFKAKKVFDKAVMTPFDLRHETPFRAHLARINPQKHLFLLVIHHIVGDGLSIGILMEELSKVYNSFSVEIQKDILKPLHFQYKDYCHYEKKLLDSGKLRKEKEFWLKTLKTPLPALQLPTDRMRPAVKTYEGKYLFSELDQSLGHRLKNFGKEQQVSPFMILLAAVNVLLHKYTSDEDIFIGSPVAGRNRRELENQVGLYLNTVALRNQIKTEQTFLQFLQEVKVNASGAFSNSNYPFDRLVQDLDLERDTSRAPLFDVLLQYQTKDVTALGLNEIKASFYPVDFTISKFDLTFTFTENDEKINFCIGFNTNLFNQQRIEKLTGHMNILLNTVLKNPRLPIRDINILEHTEELALRHMACGPELSIDNRIVTEVFEKQVRKTPSQTALVFNNTRLTYSQFDRKTNAVAHEILKHRIEPDDIVALLLPRSEQMVIGIFGILKAGGAYLPLSPELPVERLRFMLKDSRCKMLLTDHSLMKLARQIAGESITVLDTGKLNESEGRLPAVSISASSLAYVLYTSGSTGMPKGVMVEHHSLCNLVAGLDAAIYRNPPAPLNIALVSPFVFDASVKQIFYALLTGHCLDIVPDDIRLNGKKLLEYYKTHRIDVSDGTPIHLEILLDELQTGVPNYLPQRFVIGGQQLMWRPVQKLFEQAGKQPPVISNVYGPTECCDVSASLNITSEFALQNQSGFEAVPVGKPLGNVQVFILDKNLKMAPAGVNGELCIAGEGLARGYLNQPEMTREKFVETDFLPGKRIYRTGDIGRYLDDGAILLTGRADDQVKLRGFRIELNEIESCIRNYPTINSAAAILTGEGSHQELAACYTVSSKTDPDELRQFLSLHLPDYMIPAWFTELEKLPLSANGKVDKKALPVPQKKTPEAGGISRIDDALEIKLCEIWKELLAVEQLDTNDNFFKLGGHSLIAIRLVSRIHREFNIEVTIWEVFRHATVASLAKLLKTKNPSLFNPIEKAEENDYYPLSHAQRRMWMLSKLEGQSAMYNLPGALLLKGNLDVAVFEKAWNAIVRRHESLRTCFIEIDGEPFQKIVTRFDFKIETAEYAGGDWNKETLNELAVAWFDKEFDLSKLPLMAIRLVRLSADRHLFLFNMHHIIGDGWSLDNMLKELKILYDAYLNHSEVALGPLRIHYKDYAIWQNKMLEESSLVSVKDYWLNKLQKPRPLLNLPTDYKRPENLPLDGNLLHFRLGLEKTRALAELGRSRDASLFVTLLSAVYVLFYKYTGEEDILIGSPVAGRQHDDLENQIGFFINTLVLRNQVQPENSFPEFLQQVSETMNEALDNQLYPFDRLVDELDVERLQNRNPLFDVMVAWMVKNGMEMDFEFSGVSAKGIEFPITRSMFDLTFLFEESKGEIIFSIEYNTSLFRQNRIERMAQHFRQLIESILSGPEEKISALSILPEKEKEQLLVQFNKTALKLPRGKNVTGLFEEQAAVHPDATALIYEDRKVSYGNLNLQADNIAGLLIEEVNAGREDIIVVMTDDPVQSVAAVVGIMKSGAACLPLATDTPPERAAFIVRDSRAKAVLADGTIHLSETGTNILDIRTAGKSSSFTKPEINAGNLAYVIYTSGSTGTPKGVMVEHGALSNLIGSLNYNIYSRYPEPLNELMISSFAFDVSLKQIFATLCNGNILHILSNEKRLDPREISNYILNEKINIADITPSVFAVMLEEGFGETAKPWLKELFLGSEALPYKLVRNFYQNSANRGVRVTNFYGPTECCVESSFFRFNPDDMNENVDIAPIGKPAPNQQIYVLDRHLNVCPVGVPGEICIGGNGLARAYLNDPEKSAEKFIQFPLTGTRIYKTGDAGRIRPDGNIEFLGRMDEQVKIRGYRVELPEIEKHLSGMEGVGECAVALFGENGATELAAWFTAEKPVDTSALKNHLGRFLPDYMVPSCFIQLEKIPLSSNGKIDKKALPDPSTLLKKETFRAPGDEIEAILVRICNGILQKEQISMDDNFFGIGGNSLNAVRLISRLQKELNVNLPLKEIFYHPVLADLAEAVKKNMDTVDAEETTEETQAIAPASDEELKLLSELQFEDEDE
ncbi:MAG: amino acid adenylation domain-containing protein [Prolixibacteraceae bacterium]|jgi:fengycin family lipopeptide synthetase D|nr:amino acid adenylation domain-containing protein [Prolixibacteraceae bacterium]